MSYGKIFTPVVLKATKVVHFRVFFQIFSAISHFQVQMGVRSSRKLDFRSPWFVFICYCFSCELYSAFPIAKAAIIAFLQQSSPSVVFLKKSVARYDLLDYD